MSGEYLGTGVDTVTYRHEDGVDCLTRLAWAEQQAIYVETLGMWLHHSLVTLCQDCEEGCLESEVTVGADGRARCTETCHADYLHDLKSQVADADRVLPVTPLLDTIRVKDLPDQTKMTPRMSVLTGRNPVAFYINTPT